LEKKEIEAKKQDLQDIKAAVCEEEQKQKAALAFIVKCIAKAQKEAKRGLASKHKVNIAAAKKALAKQKHEEINQACTTRKQTAQLASKARTRALSKATYRMSTKSCPSSSWI
jgi:hypothetical protein